MRTLIVLCSILLLSMLGFGQNVAPGFPGYCSYGCGPYIPMLTTPSVSFATISPSPAGATNATGGLVAGATNSTLSEVPGNTDAGYTVPVWYSGGGTPLVSPAVNLAVHPMRMGRMEHEQPMHREREAAPRAWAYFSAADTASPVQAARAAQGQRHAARTYSNQDVMRQNQQNGMVKYDSKTQKIQ